jgi:hypothetical protein
MLTFFLSYNQFIKYLCFNCFLLVMDNYKPFIHLFLKLKFYSLYPFFHWLIFCISILSIISAVTRTFGLGGPKNIFLSQMNLILSKLITTLFFYYNDFLQANCTSHWFDKFEYMKPWLQCASRQNTKIIKHLTA